MQNPLSVCLRALVLAGVLPVLAAQERLRLATTTSTEHSGLLALLHPPFERQTGAAVDVIAVGTGRALRLGEMGDVDVLMVHDPQAEQRFMDAGHGAARLPVMHNDFVFLGPESDPAGLRTAAAAPQVMHRLSRGRAPFVSRGDHSGTHRKERQLWRLAGRQPGGGWYLSVGQGMGAALQLASEKQAYVLSDRGSWLAFSNRLRLVLLYQRDPALHNPYHLILVDPQRHPHVNHRLARSYAAYVRGPQGQRIIGALRRRGERLFTPAVLPSAAP